MLVSSRNNFKGISYFLSSLFIVFLTACGQASNDLDSRAVVNVPFVPEISINEIMVGQVDHAAHSILELTIESGPQMTIGAWQEIEHYAIQLQSSRSAITMGGSGVNDAMWVAQTGWREIANDMGDASVQILAAARQQDLPAILTAGDQLRAACDSCHSRYKPEVPTEGFYKLH